MTTLAAGASATFTIYVDQILTITATRATGSAVLSAQKGGDVVLRFSGQQMRDTPIFSSGSQGIVTLTAGADPLMYALSDTEMATVRLSTDGTSILEKNGTTLVDLESLRQSDGYHFHGFAPNQINSDLKFYDYSGALNDGTFQANLAAADAWASAGYLTQANPSVGGNLSLVALPALTFDYLAGDSLFIFWRGMATPEGSDMPVMGNSVGSSQNGLRVVTTSAGKLKFNVYQASGTLSRFGGTSTATCFEAAVAHSFAVAVDGVTGKHCYWVDGARDAAYASGFLTLGTGGIIDTASSATLKLGGDGQTSATVQVGVAMSTQSLVILEGRNGLGTPVVADLDLLVANLHRNPQKLVLASAW